MLSQMEIKTGISIEIGQTDGKGKMENWIEDSNWCKWQKAKAAQVVDGQGSASLSDGY